jgi:hypothetical protein
VPPADKNPDERTPTPIEVTSTPQAEPNIHAPLDGMDDGRPNDDIAGPCSHSAPTRIVVTGRQRRDVDASLLAQAILMLASEMQSGPDDD